MKKFMLAMCFVFVGVFCLTLHAQVPVSPSPVPSVSLLGQILAMIPGAAPYIPLILGLNLILSVIQQVSAKYAKSEPGWLQKISSIVSGVAKYLGSNPDVGSPSSPVQASASPPAQSNKV